MTAPARRAGAGMLEILFAVVVLAGAAGALGALSVGSGRSTAAASLKMVMELRARRIVESVAGRPFPELAHQDGGALAVAAMPEPVDAPGYLERAVDLTEATRVIELEPGLVEVVTKVTWLDQQCGASREVVARRLVCDPTFSLRARMDTPAVLP